MEKELGGKIMPKKEGKYEEIFRDFCNSFKNSKLKERRGVAGDGKSPYHSMTCKIKKPSDIQIDFSHTGNRKEIHFHNFEGRENPLFTVRDNKLTSIALEGEPTERTWIHRDLENPVTQTHQIFGKFDEIELRFHGGIYGRMYHVEAKKIHAQSTGDILKILRSND